MEDFKNGPLLTFRQGHGDHYTGKKKECEGDRERERERERFEYLCKWVRFLRMWKCENLGVHIFSLNTPLEE